MKRLFIFLSICFLAGVFFALSQIYDIFKFFGICSCMMAGYYLKCAEF